MLAITGLLGLVLLSGDNPNPKAAPRESAVYCSTEVTVEVRIVDLKGVDWRGPVHQGMKPVDRQGAVTIWTTDRTTANAIEKACQNTIQAPKVTVADGGTTNIQTENRKFYVADLERVADGPPGKSTNLAYHPDIEAARDGITTELTCEATEDGISIKAVIDESRILAIHNYDLKESVLNADPKKPANVINAQVQVPEIATCHVAGDWLVPKDGVLIVSLGARSSAYDKVVRERVMLIEPTASKPATTGAIRASHEVLAAWVAKNAPHKAVSMPPTRTTKLSMPPVPQRRPPCSALIPDLLSTGVAPLADPVAAPSAPLAMAAEPAAFTPDFRLPYDPKNGCEMAEPLCDHASKAPASIVRAVLPTLASPSISPRPHWKASLRIEATAGLPHSPKDGMIASLPLSLTHLPFALPMTWLSASIEPISGEPEVALKAPTPPTRNLPVGSRVNAAQIAFREQPVADDAALPPLPDAFVQSASSEVYPAPQAPHIVVSKNADPAQTHVAVEVNSPQLFGFVVRSADEWETVLFPAPVPSSSAAMCPDDAPSPSTNAANIARFKAVRAERIRPISLVAGASVLPPPDEETLSILKQPMSPVTATGVTIPSRSYLHDNVMPASFAMSPADPVAIPVAKSTNGSSLTFSIKGADGSTDSNSEIRLKSIEAQPVTLRMPMADGSIVEIQARVVKPGR